MSCCQQVQYQKPLNCDDFGEDRKISSIYSKCRYLQPPKAVSCRPVARYLRPDIPMTQDTIYKRSYEGFDCQSTLQCRVQACRPVQQINSLCGEFSKSTVTKLSYQPVCNERTVPIYPRTNKIFGSECPVQSLTTQKHDFVFKYRPRRSKIVPIGSLGRSNSHPETMTVHKLSFTPLYGISRTKSCKPVVTYQRSCIPMAQDTTHNLSFTPISVPCKEELPWAQKPSYVRPTIPFACDTVQKLSFQAPGCFMKCMEELEELNCISNNDCCESWE